MLISILYFFVKLYYDESYLKYIRGGGSGTGWPGQGHPPASGRPGKGVWDDYFP